MGGPQLIRQWNNCPFIPGAHAIYYNDEFLAGRSYIGITDVYGVIRYAHALDNFDVMDMDVFSDVAYFCGKTITGKPLLGWVSLIDMTWSNATLYIDSMTFNTVMPGMSSIDNIVSAAYKTTFNYSLPIGKAFGFLYDASANTYIVLQNYEVSPSIFHDVVTKIDFSGAIPSSVQSDYSISGYSMKSISLSDSSMYVAYGYDNTGGGTPENLFWKDKNIAAVPGICLYSDILPIDKTSTVLYSKKPCYYGCPFVNGAVVNQRITRVINESVLRICP